MAIREAGRTPGMLSGAHAVAEAIAAADRNNLYVSSCFFADTEKYKAFCAFYAVMRVVDDRVDDLPSRADLSIEDRAAEHDVLRAWEEGVSGCYEGGVPDPSTLDRCGHPQALALLSAVASSLQTFRVPADLWEDFFRAMHRDIDRPRFETWQEFLEYAEGASVAPTTIYLFLIASASDSPSTLSGPPPHFGLRECGYHLGIFAYLGHIVRDLAEDLRTGREGLLYFARDDMAAHGVTEQMLFDDLAKQTASPETRSLVSDLLDRAQRHANQGRELLPDAEIWLEVDCRFILELIITTYERVIEKIRAASLDPLGGNHRLSRREKGEIVLEVASRTGFEVI